MFNLKNTLGLSDEGYVDFKRGVFASLLSNLCMIPCFVVITSAIITLLDPISTGEPLNVTRLWLLFAAGVLFAVLYFLAYKNEYRKTYTVSYSESEKIRLDVAEKIRKLPLSFFSRKDLSELTTNMMDDCESIEHTMSHVAPGLFSTSISIVLACALLAIYDWRMALALFVATPISFAVILLSRKLQERLGEKHVAAKLAASEAVQEYLEGIKVVKAFGMTGEKSEALEASLKEMKSKAMKFEWITGTFITLASTILNAAIGLVVLVGAQLLSAGEIESIKVLCFAMIAMRINAPFMTVLTLLPEFFYMLISTKRMRELRQITPMEGDEKIELENLDIEFDGVNFAYNKDDVIKDLSVKIPQGRVTAFVGPSGSGKTTIFRLIARFWDVSSGKILIGGKDVRGIDPERLMSYMSFVFQDVVLFNDTVMNNIRIGKRGASDKEVFAAAKMARCDGFINEMPEGYQTLIGENGQTLSGGERQRISIARALLKDAPVVLLDEATASLDPENETEIQAAISALASGRTVIVIAHRLRTVMGADKIIVLEGGRIAEEGRSEELLAAGGLFARLYKIQQESLGWSL